MFATVRSAAESRNYATYAHAYGKASRGRSFPFPKVRIAIQRGISVWIALTERIFGARVGGGAASVLPIKSEACLRH